MKTDDEVFAEVRAALAVVADKVTAIHRLLTSIGARFARMEAGLARLEGPLTLDAGPEIEDEATIH